MFVVGRSGDLRAQLGELGADRLDPLTQTLGSFTDVGVDELHDQRDGRSSSAANAALRIPFARFSSAFSRRSRLTSADFSLVTPGRSPPST